MVRVGCDLSTGYRLDRRTNVTDSSELAAKIDDPAGGNRVVSFRVLADESDDASVRNSARFYLDGRFSLALA